MENNIINTGAPSPEYNFTAPKNGIKIKFFDIFMAFLCPILIYSFINAVIFSESGFSVMLVYLLFFLSATAYIVSERKAFPKGAVFPGIACMLTAITMGVYGNMTSVISAFLLLIPLSLYYCTALTESSDYDISSHLFFGDILSVGVVKALENIFLPYLSVGYSLKSREKSDSGKAKKLLPLVFGALVALPVARLAFTLLSGGDSAFDLMTKSLVVEIQSLMSKILGEDFYIDPFVIFATFFLSAYIYPLIFAFRYGKTKTEFGKQLERAKVIPLSAMTGFLGVICLVYVLYLLSQTAYFFSAFTGKVPEGLEMTLSEYAVRGFTEMLCVALINLVLIGVAVVFGKREDGKIPPLMKGICLFLCVFAEILVTISMAKIIMYITGYGLTEKRFWAFAADVMLLLAFASIGVKLFRHRFPAVKIITLFCISFTVLLLLANPNRIITSFNVNAYLSGIHDTVDVYSLVSEDEYSTILACDKLITSEAPEEVTYGAVEYACKVKIGEIYERHSGNTAPKAGSLSDLLVKNMVRKNADRYAEYYREYTAKESSMGFYFEDDRCYRDVYIEIDTDTPIMSISCTSENESFTATSAGDGESFEKGETLIFKLPCEYGGELYTAYFDIGTAEGHYECILMDGTVDDDRTDNVTYLHRGQNVLALRDRSDGSFFLEDMDSYK